MKIVNGFDLMKYAQDHHYMLPAFNTTNLEMTYAIAKGLNKAKLPGCRIVKAEPYARCRRKTPLGLRAKRLSRSRVQPLPS